MTILDIHTHHPYPQPEGVIAVSPCEFHPVGEQLYSVGIHPWNTVNEIGDEEWDALERAAAHPQVVAIGECGIDLLKGGPLFRQMNVLKSHAELAERVKKPVVLHCVKGQEMIISMKKELKPHQPWLVHGFRGKPGVASMFVKAGISMSFGPVFNEQSLSAIPREMLLAETDEADCTIEEVIAAISAVAGENLTDVIARNTLAFISRED